MVGYITESTGGDFKPTPEGQHIMVCSRVIDLGTQKTEYNGEVKHQRKVLITWEIPGERIEVDGRDMPVIHSEKYTWSFHEKANLRKHLEAWRGKKFREEDFSGPPNGFHIKNVLGVPCYGQIIHEQAQNGKTYANLSSIMAFPGKRDAWPTPEGDLIFLDLDDFNPDLFDKLSDYWKGVIKASPEGDMIFNAGAYRHGDPGGEPAGGRNDMDDEIPF
jgi:hypothetical protein